MPTPAEVVASLEALDPTTLTPEQRTALASARNAVRQMPHRTNASDPSSRARAYVDVPPTLEEMLARGRDWLFVIAADTNGDPGERTRAVQALQAMHDREVAAKGPVEHVVTFKGGIDALGDGTLRDMTDAILAENVQELREQLGAAEDEQARRRVSKPA